MNKKYEERPVDLLDLFWNIVFAWRSVLAWMVVFALLLTGYAGLKYKTDMKNYNVAMKEYQDALSGKVVSEEKTEEPDVEFTADEQTQITDAVQLKKQMMKMRDYVDESVLMNIDPYEEHMLSMNFYVNNGYIINYTRDNTKDNTQALVNAYTTYVNSGTVAQKVAEELKLESDVKYVDELISAGSNEDGFTIRFLYADDSIFEQAAAVIEDDILNQQPELAAKIGEHSVSLVSSETSIQADQDTATVQTNVMTALNSYRTQYNALTANMSDQQKAEIEKELRLSDTGKEENESSIVEDLKEPEHPSFSKKYPMLGILAGLFLACVWIALKQIFSNQLLNIDELTDYFDLKQVGVLHSHQGKQRKNRFDQWLRKLRYRNEKEMDDTTRLGIVCGNLELMCKRENITRICLTGSEMEKIRKTEESALQTILERLSGAGIQVLPVDNICYDMTSMRTVSEVGAVVLMEQSHESIFQEIDKELMLLNQNEINVVGAIGVLGE